MQCILAPSILTADLSNIAQLAAQLEDSEADWIHVDVMDGQFVPNLTFGVPVLAALAQHCTKPLDVHLMVREPEHLLPQFAQAGAHSITVHAEACTHLHRSLQHIAQLGCQAGVAVNPATPLSAIQHVLPLVQLVCVMSVNPGFGGQQFIAETVDKVKQCAEMVATVAPRVRIQVDGGVGPANAQACLQAGAQVLVLGNAVFAQAQPVQALAEIRKMTASW